MLLPSEFIESFEEQYPKLKLEYILPESLSRCSKLFSKINNTVITKGELEFTHMDNAGATYDMLNRKYKTIQNPNWFKLEKNGYSLIFDKIYKIYGGNLSPRSFSFILEDLSDINTIKFAAAIQIQMSKFSMEKSIALQQSWFKFCLDYSTNFTMKYKDYEDVIAKLGN